ncbi:ArsR family transcriptional regulator [Kitasatospora sp. NBC_01250]|uniref:ArsR/SmtB family transcription factor n=1 Tax=unclassified Kitasatospora TaxID=2633591 RepID=UPI002E15DB38|nr:MULTISPECIES: ArsR family transcriptional regulator [unclassified Kitasatospora]WSJ67981.1 ArsR family transcriptional regulator [Kitasatospora sp. NBC_01302]
MAPSSSPGTPAAPTTPAAPAVHRHPEPADLPEPLPEPGVAELRLEAVLGALSDPLRLHIVRALLLDSDAFDHSCSWFGLDRPKSSLTHHFRSLREAGVTRQRQYGLERRSQVRIDDLEARFPGLLALVANWTPKEG